MEKERKQVVTDEGYSEKQIDIAIESGLNNDQVRGGSIFDPRKKKVSKVSGVSKVSEEE